MTDAEVRIRPACKGDLAAIVQLFAEDELHVPLQATAEHSGPPEHGYGASQSQAGHLAAFEAIANDPNNSVYVAEVGGRVVGTFQLTFIRQLSYGGCLVAQVESVHVHSSQRSRGVGKHMLEWAIGAARERGALRVQLTSNVKRGRAHEFYERLGFRATHKGMKLYLV
jgi:GNAT superfamily N-acetyltransferase